VLPRCVQTANRVAEVLNLPIKIEYGIAEWLDPRWCPGFSGDLQNAINMEALKKEFPRIDTAYRSKIPNIKFPEKLSGVRKRLRKVVKTLSKEYPNGSLLIVGHRQMLMDIPFMLASFKAKPETLQCCTMISLERAGLFWKCTRPVVATFKSTHSARFSEDEDWPNNKRTTKKTSFIINHKSCTVRLDQGSSLMAKSIL